MHQKWFSKRTLWLTVMSLLAIALILVLVPANKMLAKSKKGYLGVQVQELTPSLKESLKLGEQSGLLICAVADDSPAEKADLADGDVILKFDGKKVDQVREFVRLVRKTEPGKTVTLEIFSEGETKSVTAKIGKAPVDQYLFGDRQNIIMVHSRPRLGVKIQKLNPDLASYFGVSADQGVLILEVDKKSAAAEAGLKAGDVLLKIASESLQSTEDILEALGEYEAGDKVSLEYLRHGKTEKVEVELKATDENSFQFDFVPPDADYDRPLPHKNMLLKIPRIEKFKSLESIYGSDFY